MSLKILLADDSVTAQNMGKKILSDAGFEVVAVSNGSAALKKIPDLKPDLVILDIYMPGYTGLEVCQKIKEARQTSSLPVLLTVGKLEPFKARDASRVRADGFIVKPFEATELLSMIKRIVGTMPEEARGKGKNGEDSKTRVKQAKLASQAASAEQLASALRNVLPQESKAEDQEETSSIADKDREHAANAALEGRDAGGTPAPADFAPFSVTKGPEASDEEQGYQGSEGEGEKSKFKVDFDKAARRAERPDDSIPFTASSFEYWEKSKAHPAEAESSREDALARIRAARETEATEFETAGTQQPGAEETEPTVEVSAETEPVENPEPEKIEASAPRLDEPAPWPVEEKAEFAAPVVKEEPSQEVQIPDHQFHAESAPAAHASDHEAAPSQTEPRAPVSGLADWAADLREEAAGPALGTPAPVSSKWIAEEVPLGSGDSSASLSGEMQRFQSGDAEPKPLTAEERAEEEETPVGAAPQLAAERESPETEESEENAPAFEAVAEGATQPEGTEAVAALAQAAAAAAMSSISEIRETVLASAAAAGVSGSSAVQAHTSPQAPEAEPAPVDMTQLAAQPPAEDVQGATIAAVTREVAEAGPADLNSDAIASIVNRVIEQMKPKLVAEIAKELTHKPKDE